MLAESSERDIYFGSLEGGTSPSEESHARTTSGEDDVHDALSRPVLRIPDAVYPSNLARHDSYGFNTPQRGYGHRTRPSLSHSEMSDDTICVSPTSFKGKGKHSRGDSLSHLLSGMASPTTPSTLHPTSPITPLTATSARSWDSMKPLPPTPAASRPGSQFTRLSMTPLAVDEQDESLQAAVTASLAVQEPAAVYDQTSPQPRTPAHAFSTVPNPFVRPGLIGYGADEGEASVYHTPAAELRRLSVLSTTTTTNDPQASRVERVHSPTGLGSTHTTLARLNPGAGSSGAISPSSPRAKSGTARRF